MVLSNGFKFLKKKAVILADCKQTNDEVYIIAGDANADVKLIKTNENGIIQWTQILEFPIVLVCLFK